MLADPLRITVGARNTANASVRQRLVFVGRGEQGKLLALRQLLAAGLAPPVLVFVATKVSAPPRHVLRGCADHRKAVTKAMPPPRSAEPRTRRGGRVERRRKGSGSWQEVQAGALLRSESVGGGGGGGWRWP